MTLVSLTFALTAGEVEAEEAVVEGVLLFETLPPIRSHKAAASRLHLQFKVVAVGHFIPERAKLWH